MHKLYTPERRKFRAKFYKTKSWRNIRSAKLRKNPLCEHCLKAKPKRITLATAVDHEKPDWETLKEFIAGPFNSLCGPEAYNCHALKTGFTDIPEMIKKEKTQIKGVAI